MNIFEALRQSHDVQRKLGAQLLQTHGASAERDEIFKQFKIELEAHETAEERYFYIPLLMDDNGVDLTRHALSEHHKIDEYLEEVEQADQTTSAWMAAAKKLVDQVHHHLSEEEHRFFQMSGKILTDKQKEQLAVQYFEEFERQKEKQATA
ncbi:hemerythrin domain-containing protein [Alkanindiges sp. WGS2144]|uniref:hemerythrin domain-containing protein n=1 Tax=Alkanindiges sp. WGS2144 TaxID=3366808 RepID=UPI003753C317